MSLLRTHTNYIAVYLDNDDEYASRVIIRDAALRRLS